MASRSPSSAASREPDPPVEPPVRLRILLLEDDASDAELEARALSAAGFAVSVDRVDSERAFAAALDAGAHDIVISDYNLPAFDGLRALEILRARGLDIPFVLVSGSLGEEEAIESLTHGATDYVSKGNLERLAPVVRRALRDTEERRQRTRLVEQLEAANRIKSDFLATLSHELRTPLNVILGYNELLLDEVFGTLTPEQAASLDRVGTSGRELLELINATLDISRLETGHSALTLQDIDPSALFRDIEAETHVLREKPGVESVWRIAPDLPHLYSDLVKLKVVLKNLIANAVKFTDRGSVTIAAEARDGWIELRVSDTGIGMTRETQGVIFEPFRQGDSSPTRRHGGVGLGLYIVSRLLGMLSGRIEVESAPGAGSTFRVWVPIDARRGGSAPGVS